MNFKFSDSANKKVPADPVSEGRLTEAQIRLIEKALKALSRKESQEPNRQCLLEASEIISSIHPDETCFTCENFVCGACKAAGGESIPETFIGQECELYIDGVSLLGERVPF